VFKTHDFLVCFKWWAAVLAWEPAAQSVDSQSDDGMWSISISVLVGITFRGMTLRQDSTLTVLVLLRSLSLLTIGRCSFTQSTKEEVTLSWPTWKRDAKNVDVAPKDVNSMRKWRFGNDANFNKFSSRLHIFIYGTFKNGVIRYATHERK
jgi:hypothetical protein